MTRKEFVDRFMAAWGDDDETVRGDAVKVLAHINAGFCKYDPRLEAIVREHDTEWWFDLAYFLLAGASLDVQSPPAGENQPPPEMLLVIPEDREESFYMALSGYLSRGR